MKKFATLVFSFLLLGMTTNATTVASEENEYSIYDGNAYIFSEGGVEFSVFPDGQFDFVYVGPNQGGNVQVSVNSPNVNLSFNSGHDYEMYVQYDDYGAVIQIEDVAVYYDGYGRITQAGNVDIQYNDRRIVRVGGLHVNYDHYGHYSGYTGYINVHNRYYVARPWHVFYVRPIFASCVVYDYQYRSYYSPVRYSYGHHRQYYKYGHGKYKNSRRDFYRPGSRVHYKNGRSAVNRSYNANRRNTMVAQNDRNRSNTTRDFRKSEVRNNRSTSTDRDRTATTRNSNDRTSRSTTRSGNDRTSRNATVDNSRSNTGRSTTKGNTRNSTVKKRTAATTRSTTKGNTRNSTVNKRTATTRSSSTRNDRGSKIKSTPQKRTTVANNRGNNTKRSNATRTASTQRVAKSSNASRANKSSQNTRSTSSRGKTSKRNRG
ncbi:hypothetical protein [Ulvibacter antarcticus]|uniref:Sperm nuclear basic protein PL-I n=1 Tax=Ulvibacter antarcticus TaxID=442714 RepID=A0A3L9YV29_9FLAO|nr:hypothetical protein [Ulvibacter antarcticus]RMA64526.1 hypothetical protein BXY75_1402 [Ulvibacter antarcticus]